VHLKQLRIWKEPGGTFLVIIGHASRKARKFEGAGVAKSDLKELVARANERESAKQPVQPSV
jgi:hypothetical protein